MEIRDAQAIIKETYEKRDRSRGLHLTFMHLIEEVGELSRAIRRDNRSEISGEMADVFAWLLSIAYLLEVNLESEFEKRYGKGCPKCGGKPCTCPPLERRS